MPVQVSEYEFRIGLYVDDFATVSAYLSEYFARTMAGWRHAIFSGKENLLLDAGNPMDATIVIVDEHLIEDYQTTRDVRFRAQDTMILISSSREGFDRTDAMSGLPETIVFLPGPIEKQSLSNVLESLILQRFAREIMNAGARSSQETGAKKAS